MDWSSIPQSPEPKAQEPIFDVETEKTILESRLEQRDRVIKLLEGEMCQSMLNRLSGHKDMRARTRIFSQETFWDRFKMAALVASAKESLNQLAEMSATVALFGEKRTGKSSIGNHLLGTTVFPVGTECTTSVPFFISSAPTGSLAQFVQDPSSAHLAYRFNPDVKTELALDSQMDYFESCLQQSPAELEEVKSMRPAYSQLLKHFWSNATNNQPVLFPTELTKDMTIFQRLLTPPANVVRGNPLVMSFHLQAPILGIDRTGVSIVDCPGLSEDILLSKLTAETIAAASVILFVYDNETSLSEKKGANVDMLLNQIGLGKQVICIFNTLKMKQKNMSPEQQDAKYEKISNELKSLISSKLKTHASPKTPMPKFIRAYVPAPEDTEKSKDIEMVRAHVLRAISEVMMSSITSALQAYHNLVSGVLLFSSRFAENIMHSALLKYSLPDPTHAKREQRYRELEAEARLLNQNIEKLLWDAQARIKNLYSQFDKYVLHTLTAQKSEIQGLAGVGTIVFAQYDPDDSGSRKRFAEELRSKLLHKVQSALQNDAETFRASSCVEFAAWLSDEVEKIEQQIQVLQQRNLRMISESDANLCISVHQDLSALPQPQLDYRWMLGSGAVVSVAGATAVVGLFMANLVVSVAIVAAFAAPLGIAGIGLGLAAVALTASTQEKLSRDAFHNSIRQKFCMDLGDWYRTPEARTAYRKTALGDLEKIVDQICAALKLRVHQAEGFATSTTCTASAEDLIQTVWIRDTAARFERDISREVQMLTGSKTWKAVAHAPDGPSCLVCGTDIQKCGHLCHICEVVCHHQCPYCKSHQEAVLGSSGAKDIQGYNPLVEQSKETMDIIPHMSTILAEAPGRCPTEPPPPKDDQPQDLGISRLPPADAKTQLERLLDSPLSVLGSHISARFSPDLISFAASFSQVDWANKAGSDQSQMARCVNLFVRSMLGALQSKVEADRLSRAPVGSHGATDARLSYSHSKKLLRACYHAVFEAEISPGQQPKKTLGEFIFAKYNQFFDQRNQKFTAWAKQERYHKDFKRLAKIFGEGLEVWDGVVQKFTAILNSAKNPWDIYKAFKKLDHYVMDLARTRAEADSKIMAKLVESPLGADDLWPAWELCVLLSQHEKIVPSLNMAIHFLVDYPIFMLDSYEPQLNFLYGVGRKIVRLKKQNKKRCCPGKHKRLI